MKKLVLAGSALAVVAAGSMAHAKVVDKPKFKVGGLVLVWGGTAADADATVVSDFYLLGASSATDLIGGTSNDVNGGASDAVVTGTFDAISGETATPANGGDVDETGGTTAGVLDAGDVMNAFGIDANTDLSDDIAGKAQGKFYVASNTGFQIKAEATETSSTTDGYDLENIQFAMTVDVDGGSTATTGGFAYGGAAQDPCDASGGASCGVDASVTRLSQMTGTGAAATTVYTANRKTAASRGSIAAQSVRFDTEYSFDSDGTAGTDDAYDLSDGVVDLEAEVVYTVYAP